MSGKKARLNGSDRRSGQGPGKRLGDVLRRSRAEPRRSGQGPGKRLGDALRRSQAEPRQTHPAKPISCDAPPFGAGTDITGALPGPQGHRQFGALEIGRRKARTVLAQTRLDLFNRDIAWIEPLIGCHCRGSAGGLPHGIARTANPQ